MVEKGPFGLDVGTYMVELAELARDRFRDSMLRPAGEPGPEELWRFGMEQVMDWIRHDLSELGVHFDAMRVDR